MVNRGCRGDILRELYLDIGRTTGTDAERAAKVAFMGGVVVVGRGGDGTRPLLVGTGAIVAARKYGKPEKET